MTVQWNETAITSLAMVMVPSVRHVAKVAKNCSMAMGCIFWEIVVFPSLNLTLKKSNHVNSSRVAFCRDIVFTEFLLGVPFSGFEMDIQFWS